MLVLFDIPIGFFFINTDLGLHKFPLITLVAYPVVLRLTLLHRD